MRLINKKRYDGNEWTIELRCAFKVEQVLTSNDNLAVIHPVLPYYGNIFTNNFFSNLQLKKNHICFGLLFFEFRSKVFITNFFGNLSSSYEKKPPEMTNFRISDNFQKSRDKKSGIDV